ncbi:MAG: PAS domain S-box protein [Deltaproteobacteria bacterium]|nr:PAS domain S-box protein [Deltaproteobacteria bacterium]
MAEIMPIKFQQLAETTPVCLIVLDGNRQLVWGNHDWRDYTGGDCSAPQPWTFAIHPDEQGSVGKVLDRVYRQPRRVTKEFRYQRHDGEYRAFRLIGAPCLQEGKVVGLVCALSDITDQQMVEEQMLTLNDSLEDMVTERTRELQRANDELKQTHSQMLHHEKMASVGQLAAGVAHEINNPMGFIASNLNSLGKYLEKLNNYILFQDQLLKDHLDEERTQQMAAQRKKLKIDYLLEDSHDLIDESLDGAQRVQEIVRNLKSFSRVDQAEKQSADLNECLESTIAIAWNELKYKVTLEKEYGDLPSLYCRPQQLNQVFMNLLVNAAHAIQEKGTVRIRTRADAENLYVEISDTGCGIPKEHLSRIFEPFFTTKDVGKGTGLGMSISYDIIAAHNGTICVDSKVGEGTKFTITLPLGAAGGD